MLEELGFVLFVGGFAAGLLRDLFLDISLPNRRIVLLISKEEAPFALTKVHDADSDCRSRLLLVHFVDLVASMFELFD